MKPIRKIVVLAFIAIAILALFLPVASFHDNSANALSADIEKQEGKVKSAQDQLDRWIAGGKKSEADIQKQRDKVAKEQTKLDELVAQQQAASAEAANSGLRYAFIPAQLPAELQIDMQLVNQYKLYDMWNMSGGQRIHEDWSYTSYTACIWAVLGCLILSALLVLLAGNKDASKLYTAASFLQLLTIILSFYIVMRLVSFPIKLPYGNATLNAPVVIMLMGGTIISFFAHVQGVHNSKRSMIYVFCSFLSALAILPFWIMIVNATRSSSQIQNGVSIIPSTFLVSNWNVLAAKNFNVAIGFKNSAIIAFGSTILSVYFSAMTTAYRNLLPLNWYTLKP